MKMVRVFSRQLREVHLRVRDALNIGEAKNPDFELMNVAEAFYQMGNVEHACYAFQKYIEHYPGGEFIRRAHELLARAQSGKTYPRDFPVLESTRGEVAREEKKQNSGNYLQLFEQGREHYRQKEYTRALQIYRKCMRAEEESAENVEITSKSLFEFARTKLQMSRFDEASAHFTQYLKKFPSGNQTRESVLHLGIIAELQGNKTKAKKIYHRLATGNKKDETTASALKRLGALN